MRWGNEWRRGRRTEYARGRAQGQEEPTLLEVVLRVQRDFRQRLAPIGVTPLQAGVILYRLRRKGDRAARPFTRRASDEQNSRYENPTLDSGTAHAAGISLAV
ncbi:MAG: hypothetical protein ACREJN_19285 [Nitrospiraceae bacterium]